MISAFLSTVGDIFAGVVVKIIAGVVIVALITGGFLWSVTNYHRLKKQNLELSSMVQRMTAEIKAESERHQEEISKAEKIRDSLKADLELQAKISNDRARKTATLTKYVEDIRKIERPDHEKNYPVHPAIGGAFDRLRSERDKN